MKTTRTFLTALTLWLAAAIPAFAASTAAPTHTVYSSGILVLAFVGFCALVLVVQLIPAIITLWGIVMGLVTNKENAEVKVYK